MEQIFCYGNTEKGKNAFFLSGLGDYSLSDTLECGQCFRFDRVASPEYECEYAGVVGDRFLHIAQRKPGELIFFDTDIEEYNSVWKKYFSLDVDWKGVKESVLSSLPDNEVLKAAADVGRGIAILRQDMWETLFSFIISQNNNIPRIKKIIRQICFLYGKKCASLCDECAECGNCYSFPSPEDILSSPEKLNEAKVGFRYRYLIDAAKKVASGEIDLESLKYPADFNYAKNELCKICGVGDKVSSCILLFAGNHLNAFPVDVWVKRAIDEYFDGNLDYKRLGDYAGVAQQYIFHYIRNNQKK